MKKFFVCLMVLFITASACFADELRLDRETQYQKKIMAIGFRILNANQIEQRMTFYYSPNKNVNAVTYLTSKQIAIFKGILPFLDSDDEIAAILCHEISHGIDAHKGLWRRLTMTMAPKSYELKADKRGIDLMVNAGYNPVAMIVVLNKIAEEPNWFETSSSHPNGSERLAALYEYIYTKYPAYLIDNDYKNNLYYQNFLLTSKDARKTIKEKYQKQSIKPVNNKK